MPYSVKEPIKRKYISITQACSHITFSVSQLKHKINKTKTTQEVQFSQRKHITTHCVGMGCSRKILYELRISSFKRSKTFYGHIQGEGST